jgi:hypothetical protein
MTDKQEIIAAIARIRNCIDHIQNLPKEERHGKMDEYLLRIKHICDIEYKYINLKITEYEN